MRRFALLWLAFALWGGWSSPTKADDRTGAAIYQNQCAACHGPQGEGTAEHYPRKLAGDRSVLQLARLIDETMPADDPELLDADGSKKVAAFIHEAFYSPAARERNRPARVELSRLTVKQYRLALADLIGGFRGQGGRDEKQGLRGEYFKSRRHRDRDRMVDRVDEQIRFDFGKDSPDPKVEAKQFAIRWTGSLLVEESGDYEFLVKTKNAAELWVNDPDRPLIDGSVRSGIEPEYSETIRLVGGRSYPIRLEFIKGEKDELASVSLRWKAPKKVAEPIPTRLLSPQWAPEAFVSTAAFPPDDRSIGYERGTFISKAWDEATTEGAIEAASYVSEHLEDLSGVKADAGDRGDRLREWSAKFAAKAFRRPLNDELKAIYVDRPFASTPDPADAVKRVVLLTLKSPRFLYREPDGQPRDPHDVAARLAFFLWDAPPDAELDRAALAGQLADAGHLRNQAERMLADPRARLKLREFFHHWLRVDQIEDLTKDADAFPGFDEAIVADLRTSLDLFLDDVAWGPETPALPRLLLAEEVFLNGRLAQFYGAELPADAPFSKLRWQPEERAGVLTHPLLMTGFATHANSSPIHRGVFVARGVLGRSLKPPPEAVAPLAPEIHPDLNTRERVALQTSPGACQTCHAMINPLGFTLERFDAVGRLRHEEKGRPIDAQGSYLTREGQEKAFTGARELARFLADSPEVHDAFFEQLFHHVVKQPIRAYGPEMARNLRATFAASGYDLRKLLVEIAVSAAIPPETTAVAAATSTPNP